MEFNQGWFSYLNIVEKSTLLFEKNRQKTFELGEYVNVKVGSSAFS